ncbi:MAG: glycosyltransferase family protein [Patescibacteria group bacterium]
MTYIFFIQGEGRGHLTQALTLKEKLETRGHKVAAVVVSTKEGGQLPYFFQEQINAPLFSIISPSFAIDRQGQGIDILATISLTLKNLVQYRRSYQMIKKIINDYQPDALVSFYEPLSGIYHRLTKDPRPLYCLGHQYFVDHPDFNFPDGHILSRLAFRMYNRLGTSPRGTRIALSFTAANDQPDKKLLICPPLIRQAIKDRRPTVNNFILIYILNAGYSEKISAWSQKHPGVKIEAFWGQADKATINKDLCFNPLSGDRFIELLASCRAYASTGGFDSIAEAAYLQKPILMNPTKNHFEQKCNAVDAIRAGLATVTENFDLSALDNEQTKTHSPEALHRFKEWVDNNDDKLVELLTEKY